jgi:OPA family glycerol-3-phosphate transporter-like MFS transporter
MSPVVSPPPGDGEAARLRRWQFVTVATLFTGYAGYYLCRSNLSIVTPLLLNEYGPSGLTKAHIGDVASFGILFYALGKLLGGFVTGSVGGKRMFLFGLFASAVLTVLLALAPLFAGPLAGAATALGLPVAVLLPFFALRAGNRLVQAVGWGAVVQITSRWFTPARMATAMGVLSISYLLGDALARLYLGAAIGAGATWRGVFFLSAGTLAAIGLVAAFALKERPGQLGLPEPPPPSENVYGADTGHAKVPLRELLAPLLKSRAFWLVCLMNVGLTLVRETFNLWNPTYLTEVAKFNAGTAGMLSLAFPLGGVPGALLAGWLADRTGGRYALVALPSLAALVGVLCLLAWVPLAGRAWLAVALIAASGFFLLAPYTFCAGVLAVKLGGQRGGAAASGLIDTAGYFGATLAGSAIGRVAQSYGWGTAFATLAVIAAVTLIASAVALRTCQASDPPAPRPDSHPGEGAPVR